jgi:hypothetical protein
MELSETDLIILARGIEATPPNEEQEVQQSCSAEGRIHYRLLLTW